MVFLIRSTIKIIKDYATLVVTKNLIKISNNYIMARLLKFPLFVIILMCSNPFQQNDFIKSSIGIYSREIFSFSGYTAKIFEQRSVVECGEGPR